jgi:hypothetical protein
MVLVIGFGVVPTPTPTESTGIRVPGITPPDHADLLVFIENRGILRQPGAPPAVTTTLPPTVPPTNVVRPF